MLITQTSPESAVEGEDSAMESLQSHLRIPVPANMAMSAIIIILIIDGFSDIILVEQN